MNVWLGAFDYIFGIVSWNGSKNCNKEIMQVIIKAIMQYVNVLIKKCQSRMADLPEWLIT